MTDGYVVTWAIGISVSLAQPHEIHPHWKFWRRGDAADVAYVWPLVGRKTEDQFRVLAENSVLRPGAEARNLRDGTPGAKAS